MIPMLCRPPRSPDDQITALAIPVSWWPPVIRNWFTGHQDLGHLCTLYFYCGHFSKNCQTSQRVWNLFSKKVTKLNITQEIVWNYANSLQKIKFALLHCHIKQWPVNVINLNILKINNGSKFWLALLGTGKLCNTNC